MESKEISEQHQSSQGSLSHRVYDAALIGWIGWYSYCVWVARDVEERISWELGYSNNSLALLNNVFQFSFG